MRRRRGGSSRRRRGPGASPIPALQAQSGFRPYRFPHNQYPCLLRSLPFRPLDSSHSASHEPPDSRVLYTGERDAGGGEQPPLVGVGGVRAAGRDRPDAPTSAVAAGAWGGRRGGVGHAAPGECRASQRAVAAGAAGAAAAAPLSDANPGGGATLAVAALATASSRPAVCPRRGQVASSAFAAAGSRASRQRLARPRATASPPYDECAPIEWRRRSRPRWHQHQPWWLAWCVACANDLRGCRSSEFGKRSFGDAARESAPHNATYRDRDRGGWGASP